MGNLAKGECENRQRKSCITETNCKHSKGGYGRLWLGDAYICHELKIIMHKFEKVDSRTFFHKFTQRFIDRGFSIPWKPAINRILETMKTTLCNSKQTNLVAIGLKEQSFKTTCESLDDRASPKTTKHGSITKGERIINCL